MLIDSKGYIMNKIITVRKTDILKTIYFVLGIIQKQKGSSMAGSLSSKGDLMGGIFDRWINTFPERIVFEKIMFPELKTDKIVEPISDFYSYDPRKAGIAPDLIGIKVDKKVIPFSIFDEKWTAVSGMPQIEIKTFKKQKQKMVSLRNQGYDDKYLIMVENDLRIDYLLPYFIPEMYSEEIYKEMTMNNESFVISNENGLLGEPVKVHDPGDELGTIQLIKIAKASDFMKCSTFCDEKVGIQNIKNIEERESVRGIKNDEISPLSKYCSKMSWGLYRFNKNWFDNIDDNGIPYYIKTGNKVHYKSLDFYADNPDKISVVKKSRNSMYLFSEEDNMLNNTKLEKGKYYKVDFAILERGGGSEYFLQKELVKFIPDAECELMNELNKIIERS
ncbi:hypothetical protein [Candidatus Nanosyncoccus alces]|uniref:Uncharacterized protein n=1 Tax=Candidatus Nanosyncoccus alces TaxID=2171997 RepID=A0ABY0FNA9_9BACT|nr:hypothetical protein [Candidatus Nanosyncoccus alces]RYC74380.1 hypothetical protein G3RUM_00531 [Candidatus Nanosyncoccus alces]